MCDYRSDDCRAIQKSIENSSPDLTHIEALLAAIVIKMGIDEKNFDLCSRCDYPRITHGPCHHGMFRGDGRPSPFEEAEEDGYLRQNILFGIEARLEERSDACCIF